MNPRKKKRGRACGSEGFVYHVGICSQR